MAGRRLDQVDAMRPIKQAGVISTHSILYFAPAAASVGSGAALLLLHVSREGFFFISACMLTYAYPDLRRAGLGRFYWRRFVSVAVPYSCWTVIYFCYLLPKAHYASVSAAAKSLVSMAYTGYFQLYFLLVIMQFYLLYPLVLMLLRRTRGHHGRLIAAAVLAQVTISILTHWHILPPLMIRYGQRDALSYLLYLIGGGVVAFHLDEVDQWVRLARAADRGGDGGRCPGRGGRLLPGPARREHRAGVGQRPVPAQRHPVQRRRDRLRVPGRRRPGAARAVPADASRGARGLR